MEKPNKPINNNDRIRGLEKPIKDPNHTSAGKEKPFVDLGPKGPPPKPRD